MHLALLPLDRLLADGPGRQRRSWLLRGLLASGIGIWVLLCWSGDASASVPSPADAPSSVGVALEVESTVEDATASEGGVVAPTTDRAPASPSAPPVPAVAPAPVEHATGRLSEATGPVADMAPVPAAPSVEVPDASLPRSRPEIVPPSLQPPDLDPEVAPPSLAPPGLVPPAALPPDVLPPGVLPAVDPSVAPALVDGGSLPVPSEPTSVAGAASASAASATSASRTRSSVDGAARTAAPPGLRVLAATVPSGPSAPGPRWPPPGSRSCAAADCGGPSMRPAPGAALHAVLPGTRPDVGPRSRSGAVDRQDVWSGLARDRPDVSPD